MTILVTGGAGYIGSHVVGALRAAGRDAVVIDDLRTGNRACVPADVPLIEGDVGSRRVLDATFANYPFSAVIHLAASTRVEESLSDPTAYHHNNVVNTRTLAEACRDYGVRGIVFASTAAVYGATDDSPVDENRVPQPISPYGASKLLAERVLENAAENGVSCAILRCFNVAGADPALSGMGARGNHLVRIACDVARGRRERLTIFGTDYPTPDGTGVRDYVDVCDLAQAHLCALGYVSSSRRLERFNVGYGRGHSVREVVAAVEAECGHRLAVAFGERRNGDAAVVVANPDRIRSALGWQPRSNDIGTIIRRTLAAEDCCA